MWPRSCTWPGVLGMTPQRPPGRLRPVLTPARGVGRTPPFRWSLRGSNSLPSACHADALPGELRPRYRPPPCAGGDRRERCCQGQAGRVVAPAGPDLMPFPLWSSQVVPCPCPHGSAGDGAGVTGLEPATFGFGGRCATCCATPLCSGVWKAKKPPPRSFGRRLPRRAVSSALRSASLVRTC